MKIIRSLALLSLVVFVSGCALTRSVVELPKSAELINPVSGPAVKFVSIEDKRVFVVDPKIPEIPSISENEINNAAIQARAIARKRNGYGAGVGDVLLPENESVVGLWEGELKNAFRESGYRVVEPNDPDYATAVPVSIEIHQYWSWMKMGFWQGHVGNISEIKIDGNLGKTANSKVILNNHESPGLNLVVDEDWIKTSQNGLRALMVKVKAYLKS